MADTPFLVRHWELVMLAVLAICAIEATISWKLGLHRRLGISSEDALLAAGVMVGLATILGGGALVIWLLADAITSVPGW